MTKLTFFTLAALLILATSWSLGLAAPVPAPTDFWVRDQPGRITHACGGKEPMVLCMQGRKVVMQVQCDRTNGFSYTARFFNLQKEVEKKQVLFVAGREATPEVRVNDQPWKGGLPSSVAFDGMLTLTYPEAGGVVVTRTVYPSMTKALVIEEWQVRNTSDKPVVVTVAPARTVKPVEENVAIVWSCPGVKTAEVKAGGVLSFFTCVQAGLAAEPDPAVNVATERGARLALAEAAWRGPGRLETPEPMLDHAFALQKLHVLESPIETIKGVITHNGSLTYSPGIWANDPPEYSSPLFPFFGDAELNKASMNMYRVWLDYSREHGDAIPGCFWQPTLQVGQWERGDDAMILYGLSKFLLFQGDRAGAEEMWPLIERCAASVLRHTTADGIVASKSDEMEDRYPTGDANLSTSSLAYGGYRLAARLAQSLGKTDVANMYDTRAAALRKAIESSFGGEVEGFKTYRYYTGNTTLRGWILLPLAMDITERQNATLDAMVSDKLWPNRMQGADILAESTRPTEWGRETYYALRVLFKAGRTEEAIDLTRRVVKAQIFGARGPYPDEDAIDMLCPGSLYPRVFTEGMFGIVPTGLDSFECTPWLPKDWPRMALRDIRAFGQSWDLVVERVGDQQKVTVLRGGKTLMTGSGPAGKTYTRTFPTAVSAKPVLRTSPIDQPYPYISTGSFSGPAVPESPDPLVAYRWPSPKATDGLEIYLLKPSTVSSDTAASFDNLGSLTTDHPNVTVNGAGSIRMDFGAELPSWVEFDSADCPGDVEMSISEYNQPGPDKTKAPVKRGTTYRLELNAELYEGVRFAWIHVKAPAKPWHITGIRAVCQVKPTNYDGSFSCSDPMLTKAWYMSAYGVKACLVSNYFSSILLERGDRIPWVGDAPASQAAGLVAFGNSDFVKANIDLTAGGNNGIIAYSLYWVIGLLDYYQYTGDAAMMEKYLNATCAILDHSYQVYGTNPKLKFFGWDERVGTGFEIWYRGGPGAQEAQNAYKMLSLRMWSDFAAAMGAYGRADLQAKYNGYAEAKMAELRKNRDWHSQLEMHALAEVAASGRLNDVERKAIAEKEFLDRVTRLSFDPFCQLFINQAMARINLYDEAFTSIKDVWGGIIKLGGTTPWECYRPSWNSGIGVGDPVPNSQSGITSLCHPWGAGPVKWLNEEVLGIKPTTPGFKTFDVVPHLGRSLTRVAGKTPTPHGEISASFDVNTGTCKVTVPAGTVGRIGIPKVEKTIAAIAVNGTKAWDGVYHAVTGIGRASQDSEFVYLSSVQPGTYSIEVSYSGKTPEYNEPQEKYAAQFMKQDKTTGGDWGGVYGKDGYVLCNYKGDRNDGKALPMRLIRGEREEVILDIRNDEKALPSYVTSVEYYRAFPKSGLPDPQMWAAETADKRALAPDKHNGANRKAAGYSNSGETMSVTIGIDGKREYQVALYFVDWNKNGCRQAVEMIDAETLNQIAPVKIVDDFSGGAYLVYHYNKSAKFRINKVRGSIASLSGIFFDPAATTSASHQP